MTQITQRQDTEDNQPSVPPKTAKKRSRKKQPKNFKEAYQVLKTNATTLQHQDEPDIDNLMTTVEESIQAYKICQQRIDAVQQALDATFANDDISTDNIKTADLPTSK